MSSEPTTVRRLEAAIRRRPGVSALGVIGIVAIALYILGGSEVRATVNGAIAGLLILVIGGFLLVAMVASALTNRGEPAEPLVIVRKYDAATPGGARKRYEQDAQELSKRGYFPVTDSNDPGIPLLLGFGQSKTVTYRKDPTPAPAPRPRPATPPPAASIGVSGSEVEASLAAVQRLHDQGLITADEWAAKRQEILDRL